MRWKRRDGVMNAGARRVQRVYLVLVKRATFGHLDRGPRPQLVKHDGVIASKPYTVLAHPTTCSAHITHNVV